MNVFWKIMNVIGYSLTAGIFGILAVRAGKLAMNVFEVED